MRKSQLTHGIIAIMSALTLCMGCSSEDQLLDEAEAFEGQGSLDPENNGTDLNGRDANGRDANGRDANGRDANGKNINGLKIDQSNLVAEHPDGSESSGTDLIGVELNTTRGDGTPITLRIDNVEVEDSYYGDVVYMYTIAFRESNKHKWAPLCGIANNAPIRAVPLQGQWDYRQGVAGGGSKIDDPDMITFACEGFTLQKCVRLGYEPWREVNGVLLSDHHQACVRLHRADYCGDGRSYTQDGTIINLYDDIGIQEDTETWTFEAEWTVDGARCLTKPRISGKKYLPTCAFELPSASCGTNIDWNVTLIVNEH